MPEARLCGGFISVTEPHAVVLIPGSLNERVPTFDVTLYNCNDLRSSYAICENILYMEYTVNSGYIPDNTGVKERNDLA